MTTLRDHLGTNRRQRIGRVVVGACVAFLSLAGLTDQEARATGSGPGVAVPAYFWSSTQWDRMLVNSAELRYVVLNPDSGPGVVSYPTFVSKVASARSQGATVIGYVDTTYAGRPLAAVKADIDKYRNWYGVNSFFFDQTPYDCAQIAYYDELKTYVRAQSLGLIFHNPGMNPQECYLNAADVIVNFEGSEATYAGWTPAAYASTYPADRFWHIVYSVDPTHGPALRATATGHNAGLVYLTEQAMPNPFSVVPTDLLWDAQTPTRSGRRAAPQVPAPSTSIPVPGRPNAPQSVTPTTTTTVPLGAENADPGTTPSSTQPPASPTSVVTTTIAPTSTVPPSVTVSSTAPSTDAPSTSTPSTTLAPTTLAPTTVAPTSTGAPTTVLPVASAPSESPRVVPPSPDEPPLVPVMVPDPTPTTPPTTTPVTTTPVTTTPSVPTPTVLGAIHAAFAPAPAPALLSATPASLTPTADAKMVVRMPPASVTATRRTPARLLPAPGPTAAAAKTSTKTTPAKVTPAKTTPVKRTPAKASAAPAPALQR